MQQSGDEKPRPIWVSVKSAMELTSFGRTRLYELINAGKLASTKVGGKRLVSYQSILDLGEPTGMDPLDVMTRTFCAGQIDANLQRYGSPYPPEPTQNERALAARYGGAGLLDNIFGPERKGSRSRRQRITDGQNPASNHVPKKKPKAQ